MTSSPHLPATPGAWVPQGRGGGVHVMIPITSVEAPERERERGGDVGGFIHHWTIHSHAGGSASIPVHYLVICAIRRQGQVYPVYNVALPVRPT